VFRYLSFILTARTIAMHSRVIGKPGRLMALKRFMDYLKSKPDVWVCTRREMAEHCLKTFPYKGPTAEMHKA
jgi:peptidoglycan/xylan/chitin deacetylase (PgdA/CDA1 family)